ncbi:MAG: OFA family MFS transporter [Deltaproteobacteria bacterium]|nr:OFA family MFS transporter [Candidatus Zymogenaceae bacterium]
MSEGKTMNRWWVVFGAILIQLVLGAIYAWSVFTPYLTGKESDGFTEFGFTATQSQFVFAVGLLSFAIMMILAGRWQDKAGPQKVAITGGIILGIGYVLASFFGGTFLGQLICIGIIGGAGIGLAYVCPIAAGVKWFPDKKGMITGLAVAGFGFGALIWIKLAGSWFHLIATMGVLKVFLLYGIIFAAAVLIGSIFVKNPPEGYKPAGWEPPAPASAGGAGSDDFSSGEMLKTYQFYFLWIMFVFSALAGLMVIGNIKLFGIDALETYATADVAARASAIAGTAMAIFYSLLNGIGRITWGSVSDKLTRPKSIFAMTLFQAVMMAILFWLGRSEWGFYIAAALIGFNFGGNFALFPTATADFFGAKNLGANYGLVFTAYGIAGIIGPTLGGKVFDATGSYLGAFIPAAVLCLIASVLALIIKKPVKA